MEDGGMGVDMDRAGDVVGGERRRLVQRAAEWPYDVCGGGVGDDLVQCTGCQRWVRGGSGGMGGGMSRVMESFMEVAWV